MSPAPTVGNRLTADQMFEVYAFALITAKAWQEAGQVRGGSWAFTLTMTRLPNMRDWSRSNLDVYSYGVSCDDAEYNVIGQPHNRDWYGQNADHKNEICLEAQMDSMEAVALYPGIVRHIDRAFPWGGGVFDSHYCLIVGTSGFEELEDILFSRTIRNYVVMVMDTEGKTVMTEARKRGESSLQDVRENRFTELPSGIQVPPRGQKPVSVH